MLHPISAEIYNEQCRKSKKHIGASAMTVKMYICDSDANRIAMPLLLVILLRISICQTMHVTRI